jgi:hypothetical protein
MARMGTAWLGIHLESTLVDQTCWLTPFPKFLTKLLFRFQRDSHVETFCLVQDNPDDIFDFHDPILIDGLNLIETLVWLNCICRIHFDYSGRTLHLTILSKSKSRMFHLIV